MLKITVDPSSRYNVIVPDVHDQAELTALVDEFLAYDQTLPPDMQSVFANHLADLRQECTPQLTQFYSSEAQRSIASDNVKRLEEEAGQHLKQAQHNLKALYWQTPAEAEAWGFEVKQTTGNITYPHTKNERLRVLESYITKEESRPEEERFTTPDLAHMIEIRDQLLANIRLSKSNQKQRRSSRIARDETFNRLKETLRLAAGTITILQFDHKISPELYKWGFEVVERPSKADENNEEEAAQDGDAQETAPVAVATNGSATLTGAANAMLQPVSNGDTGAA